jgi:uncharacterized membrane protein
MKKVTISNSPRLRSAFNILLAGISSILPVSLTFYVLYRLFIFIDNIFAKLIERIVGFRIIGLGFFLTISFIMFIGFLTKHYIGERIMEWVDRFVMKIPFAQIIYSGVKDISNILSKKGKEKFTQVVSVRFPTDKTTSIGFVTNDDVELADENLVAVFIPTTPNPTNGFLVFVDQADITYLDISIDKAIKMIVSMGAVAPNEINSK